MATVPKWVKKAQAGDGLAWKILDRVKPLKRFMTTLLNQKGIRVSSDISMFDLLLLFATEVLGGKAAEQAQKLRRLAGMQAFGGGGYAVYGAIPVAALAAVSSIVSALVAFFKDMKKADDEGKLPPGQSNAVQSVGQYVDAAQQGQGTVIAGKMGQNIPANLAKATPFILAAVAIFIGYKLTKK